ncbi:hypothetical protein CMI37_21740 [Candidatus Pacearchaeota archaeon]|nr:hypothetical protein [Candidatus Pacearchaeota archaeon]|tara:strand:+ start:1067 stop:1840 length:774 start_codon:yes stop_codon:yes gene_type:complete
MNPFSKTLRSFMHRMTVLPNDAQCETCGYFDITDERVVAIIRESGQDPLAARCRCPEVKAAADSVDRRRWNAANLPHRAIKSTPRTFQGFQARDGAEAAVKAAQAFVSLEGPAILVLIGAWGTGKTHLAEAVAREWLHRGRTCRYDYVPDLLDELRSTFNSDGDDTVHGLMNMRHAASLLILDDLGVVAATPFAQEKLTALVDQRYRQGTRLLVTTNLSSEQMAENVGERIASRLWDRDEVVDTVYLNCSDYRQEPK